MVVDGHFLPKNPAILLKEKNFNDIPYIVGFNSDEGSGLMQLANLANFKAGLTEEQFDQQLKMTMSMFCPHKVGNKGYG